MSAETQRPLLAVLVTVALLQWPLRCVAASPPAWAYPVNPPGFQPSPLPDTPLQVPGSRERLRGSQLRDLFYAPDWHPQEHPPLPPIVATGRKPEVYACGYCHRANGAGGPENASLAGPPYDYIVQQMGDFRSGARRSCVAERLPPRLMIELSRGISEPEIRAAAAYFSRLRPVNRITVIETDSVPLTFVAGWFLGARAQAAREPIGRRIIEVPRDLEQFERRDSRARFVAYVPVGSAREGRRLVESTGGAPANACRSCHGRDLGGSGVIPGIAGRSPSYIFRQLFDIQAGVRAGAAVSPMRDVLRGRSEDDLLAIAAYLASVR